MRESLLTSRKKFSLTTQALAFFMPQASDSSTFQLLLMNIESRDDVTRVGKKLGKIHCMSYDLRDVPIIFTQKLAGKVPT